MIEVEVNICVADAPLNADRLRDAVRTVCHEAQFTAGEVSLAIVDDAEMHRLNLQYLQHDDPTDVLSFVLTREDNRLEGEIIVSFDTAARQAETFGWTADDELLLYTIHGALHLVGYDDQSPADRAAMREEERRHLARWNLAPRYEEPNLLTEGKTFRDA